MKNRILLILLLFTLIFSCEKNKKNTIYVGEKTKEFTISKSDSISYNFNLEKDKFYSITVMQKGIDVEIFLKNKKGEVLEEKDSPNGNNGPEQIYYYCENTNDYVLQIIPFNDDDNDKRGSYDIEVVEISKKTTFKLSKTEYLKDFQIFKEIFEKANSGLYKYHSKHQIDSAFTSNLNRINDNITYRDFYNLIWNIIDYTGSCHNSLDFPEKLEILLNRKPIYFPIPLKYIQGKLYSNFQYKDIPAGTEILSVNGIDAKSFSEKVGHYNSTDGFNKTGKFTFIETALLPTYIYYMLGEQDAFNVEFLIQNKKKNIKINSVTLEQFYVNYSNRFSKDYENRNSQDYSFRKIDSINAGILTVNTFAIGDTDTDEFQKYNQFLDSTFTMLNNTNVKSLIVDVRKNGGGNDPCDLLLYSYLTKREFRENKSAFISSLKIPFEEYYVDGDQDELNEELKEEFTISKDEKHYQNSRFNEIWEPKQNAYKGQIYVLISPYVASAGSLFASMTKSDSETILIGEETLGGYYGHTGHTPLTYKLPNSKLLLTFSIVDLEQDVQKLPDEKFGDGIRPDYKVIQSYSDYMNNQDTQLKFIIDKITAENNVYKK